MRVFLLLTCVLFALFRIELASATCVIASGWTNRIFNITFPASMTYATNLPVGGVIGSQTISLPRELIYNCAQSDNFVNTGSSYYTRSNSDGIMITNVSGVGVRTTVINNVAKVVFPFTVYSGTNLDSIYFANPTSVLMEFIKTGPITGGTIDPGYYTGMKGPDGNWFSIFNVPTGIKLVSVGCTVTNTSITVPMGIVKQTSFSGIGPSTTTSNFSVPLNCILGTKVSITINGTADASGTAGVIALDSSTDTIATGIGLQILNNNTPVTLGTPVAAMTAAPDGPFSIPFTARYYQTTATIKAGKANATATFTMTYN